MYSLPGRSRCVCASLALLMGWFGSVVIAAEVDSDRRPNLIFLMSDDQCICSMGCYGTPGAKTPYLDALARDRMLFDNHYVTTAICMASRARAMTDQASRWLAYALLAVEKGFQSHIGPARPSRSGPGTGATLRGVAAGS